MTASEASSTNIDMPLNLRGWDFRQAQRHVGPDLALTAVDELLDLRHEPVNQPRPHGPGQRIPARIPDRHVTRHGLRITPGQLRGRPGRPGEVERLENLH